MEIEYYKGCTNDSLTIDGKESIEMSCEELSDYINKLVGKLTNIAVLQDVLITIVESEGKYEFLGTCEECGDIIEQYTLKT